MPCALGRPLLLFVLAAVLLSAAACGPGGEMDAPTAADSAEAGEDGGDPAFSYEMYMQGMLADTLRGEAEFGVVFDPVTRQRQWVLSMRSGGDVTSGVYIARPDTVRPSEGTYQIVNRRPIGAVDSMRSDDVRSFTMIYRAGMRRSFHSQSGTLELTVATDTLLKGTFRATLDGTASPPGQPPREGTLTVRGTFRAEKATVGFMFGI